MELLPWISRGQALAGSETWLIEYIGKGFIGKGKGLQEVWTFLKNEASKFHSGAGHLNARKSQAGRGEEQRG